MPKCKKCGVTFERKYGQGAIPVYCGKCKSTIRYKKVVLHVTERKCRTCNETFIIKTTKGQYCQPCQDYVRKKKENKGKSKVIKKREYTYNLSENLGRCILDEKRNHINNAMLEYLNQGNKIKVYDPLFPVD